MRELNLEYLNVLSKKCRYDIVRMIENAGSGHIGGACSHEKEDEIFEKLGYIDAHHMAPKVKAEVLMAITLMDDICPPSTQFAVYNQLQTKKEAVLYYDHGHEILLPGCQDRFYQYLCEIVQN